MIGQADIVHHLMGFPKNSTDLLLWYSFKTYVLNLIIKTSRWINWETFFLHYFILICFNMDFYKSIYPFLRFISTFKSKNCCLSLILENYYYLKLLPLLHFLIFFRFLFTSLLSYNLCVNIYSESIQTCTMRNRDIY